ncbi:pilus assembly protein TadG-related protein [Tundrisphaera sp. TA3]|uniref:pilus assembly protein TadG-related protein n=1 Tax=Tundrisphaera sp. TA3 TaxID=3435775 RepID=UPI003EBD11D3
MIHHVRRMRHGTVLILFTICLVPMIFVMALVLDGGLLMGRKRQAQAVADAGARAAACSLYSRYTLDTGLDPLGKASAAGLAIAAANGFPNDGTTASVTINVPPSAGSAKFAGKAGCAEAIITIYQPRYFGSVFGTGKIPVRARAVAQVKSSSNPSLIVTDIHLAGALTLTGGAKLVTNSDIIVNSDSLYNVATNPLGGAINISNGAFIDTGTALTKVAGNFNIPGWASLSTFLNIGPLIGHPGTSDPYASMPAPTTAGLVSRSAPNPLLGLIATVNPGVYNGGLTLGNGLIVTMNPGLYYMKGGSFTVANGVKVIGTGVTIYTDSGGGSLNFQGGATVALTAPTTTAGGGIPGILYFQDRANASALNNIANGAVTAMIGTIYAPSSPMTIAGGAIGAQLGSQFIVRSLTISNGMLLTINTPVSLGGTVSKPALVE